MEQPEWMKDPALTGIDQTKLNFLQMMVFESQSLSQKEMLPFLINLSRRGADNAISFSREEIELIIGVIKKNSTPDEIARMDKIMNLIQQKQ